MNYETLLKIGYMFFKKLLMGLTFQKRKSEMSLIGCNSMLKLVMFYFQHFIKISKIEFQIGNLTKEIWKILEVSHEGTN